MRKSRLTNNIIVILTALLLCAVSRNSEIAEAAGLNTYESEVISAANGNFELNGIKYQVEPVFIQQLRDYLNQEDVDINASQKDEIIGMMFSNVEQGVAEGYLVPINVQEDIEIVENGEDELSSDNTPEHNEGTSNDEEKPEEIKSEMIENDAKNEAENDYTKVLNEIRKQPTTKTEVDQNRNKVTVTQEDNNVLVVNTVIKNTGFNIRPVIAIATGLLGIFMLCMIITIKYNFFKQEER